MVKPRLFIAERVCTEFLSFNWLLRSSITPKKKMFSVHRISVASSKKKVLVDGGNVSRCHCKIYEIKIKQIRLLLR